MILNWCPELAREDTPPPGEPPGASHDAVRTSAEIIIFPGLHLRRLQAVRELRQRIGKPSSRSRAQDYACSPERDEPG